MKKTFIRIKKSFRRRFNKSGGDHRYLAAPAIIDETFQLRFLSPLIYMIGSVLAALIAWSSIANIKEITRTSGEVVPSSSIQSVQHVDGGVIEKILTTEGQLVEKGQELVFLRGDGINEDMNQALQRQQLLLMREERFRAFVDGRAPNFSRFNASDLITIDDQSKTFDSMIGAINREGDILEKQIEQRRIAIAGMRDQLTFVSKNTSIARDLYERRQKLAAAGHFPKLQLLETERQVNELESAEQQLKGEIRQGEQALLEYRQRLKWQSARTRDEAYANLDRISGEIAENRELVGKLRARVQGLSVQSPVRGLVKQLSVKSIGGVIGAGGVIAEIVPLDDELIVEIKIAPKDIGSIGVGHPVDLKFSAYDYSTYGSVKGTVEYLSATTFFAENGERYYRGRVKLAKNYVGAEPQRNPIIPGMTAMADIILGDRTVLGHLLNPLQKVADNSFKEQ